MREGILPLILGAVVTSSGIAMRVPDIRRHGMSKDEVLPMVATGLIGFGLAHIVLGSIDIIQNR